MTTVQAVQCYRQLAAELYEAGAPPPDLSAGLVKAGVEMSLPTAGPVETIEGLLLMPRQLSADFRHVFEVVRFSYSRSMRSPEPLEGGRLHLSSPASGPATVSKRAMSRNSNRGCVTKWGGHQSSISQ